MPEKKFDKHAYDVAYLREHTTRKVILFNKGKPDDMKMLEWLNMQGERKFQEYVKRLIREDMNKGGKQNDEKTSQ